MPASTQSILPEEIYLATSYEPLVQSAFARRNADGSISSRRYVVLPRQTLCLNSNDTLIIE